MTLLNIQLNALGYPHSLDLSSPESTRKLVVWLENLKIREYKIEDRKALSDIQSATWGNAFKKYLADLECPVPPGPDLRPALEWLLAFSLNLEYEDNADKLGIPTGSAAAAAAASTAAAAAAPSTAGRPAAAAAAPKPSRDDEAFTDLHDPDVVAAVEALTRAAGLPPPDASAAAAAGPGGAHGGGGGGGGGKEGDLVDRLQAAAERLVCGVGPALEAGGWREGRPARQALVGVPLGFELADEKLATAATVLRLLYIRDLRRLQTQIDHALVEMQEYTANPKTDSSLGKVGR